jgi:hypothetical protein
MVLTDLRQELASVRAEAAQANNAGVVEKLDRILAGLDDDVLLTTREAAGLLGIGSVNTIKAMAHAGRIQSRKGGYRGARLDSDAGRGRPGDRPAEDLGPDGRQAERLLNRAPAAPSVAAGSGYRDYGAAQT